MVGCYFTSATVKIIFSTRRSQALSLVLVN